jgi:hypothetical protein
LFTQAAAVAEAETQAHHLANQEKAVARVDMHPLMQIQEFKTVVAVAVELEVLDRDTLDQDSQVLEALES